jgi:hypothetical protein
MEGEQRSAKYLYPLFLSRKKTFFKGSFTAFKKSFSKTKHADSSKPFIDCMPLLLKLASNCPATFAPEFLNWLSRHLLIYPVINPKRIKFIQ